MLKHAMSAASKAEIAGAFLSAKLGAPERMCLLEMGHPQPETPLEMDNTTAYGTLTKQLMPKLSKATDMRFLWLWDRANKNQFHLCWKKGEHNKADCFTKHHPAVHHKKARSFYLTD